MNNRLQLRTEACCRWCWINGSWFNTDTRRSESFLLKCMHQKYLTTFSSMYLVNSCFLSHPQIATLQRCNVGVRHRRFIKAYPDNTVYFGVWSAIIVLWAGKLLIHVSTTSFFVCDTSKSVFCVCVYARVYVWLCVIYRPSWTFTITGTAESVWPIHHLKRSFTQDVNTSICLPEITNWTLLF